jgi:hypothetical protein
VRLLGRVGMTTRVVLLGMMPVAYIAGGVLARAAGPQALFTAAAAVGLVVSGWATLSGLGGLRVTDSAG